MRAIVLSGFGGLESLVIKELPDPQPKALVLDFEFGKLVLAHEIQYEFQLLNIH